MTGSPSAPAMPRCALGTPAGPHSPQVSGASGCTCAMPSPGLGLRRRGGHRQVNSHGFVYSYFFNLTLFCSHCEPSITIIFVQFIKQKAYFDCLIKCTPLQTDPNNFRMTNSFQTELFELSRSSAKSQQRETTEPEPLPAGHVLKNSETLLTISESN